ncbi:MAG TPA: ABC transporter substrate-binding protein [Anaeromyxobacteraceae bacterium]|nr:ABC transporter substrate-binding protein [Anaeromyxobacteraceae bacterium]
MIHGRALATAAVALALTACERKPAPGSPPGPGAAGEPILLGLVASLTGSEATFGDSSDKGIRLAVDEVNAAGGVKGRRLAVKTYDDQGKAEEASVAATRLVVQDRAAVLLGEVASSLSLAMAPIADAKGVPMISPSSTNPRVTVDDEGKVRPFVFRVCFTDPFQGMVMARFAREKLGLGKVAILRDVKNAYSVGLADYFLSRFTELGGTVVDDQSYKAGDPDFKAQLTAIKGKGPEAVYIPGYYGDVGLIARQARELGMKQTLLGGDGWDSARLFEIGGHALEGSYFSNLYSPDDPAPRIQEFVAKYRARHGVVPDSLAAQAYDAARIAADAMARAPDLSGTAIRDALAATRGYPGVTGVITIDEHHDAVKPAVVLEVRGGAARWVATIEADARK